MMAGYFAEGLTSLATFELFVRRLPPRRSFLVAAGLEQALGCLEALRFTDEEVAYLRALPAMQRVGAAFFDEHLPHVRFTGEVWAVPEGTPVFASEPLVRVTAPIGEAQLVETALLAIVGFQTTIASKAVRIVEAARGLPVIEFGMRRAHGLEAGLYAARAAYLAGCLGTANVEAGFRFGIPVFGTMAHSWVMAHADELEAFRRFAAVYGDRAILLIDTYDPVAAARKIVASGLEPAAVRLDSGDVTAVSRKVRAILDRAGLKDTGIFVSGDLDEHRIARLLRARAPVSAFGVGTALSTSKDAPALGAVYKLVEIERDGARLPAVKLSAGKPSWPGSKQVWRTMNARGIASGDVVARDDEPGPAGALPLLALVMKAGRRVSPSTPLDALRESCRASVSQLPRELRDPRGTHPYRVVPSPRLTSLNKMVRASARRS